MNTGIFSRLMSRTSWPFAKHPRRSQSARRRNRRLLAEQLETRQVFDGVVEPNNTFDTAFTPTNNIYLEQNYYVSEAVSTSSDSSDMFKFYNLYGASHLYLALNGLSNDADVYVYDTNRNPIASSTNGSNLSELINVDLAGHEYFYVEVRAFSGATNYNLLLYNDYAGPDLARPRDVGASWGQSNGNYWAYDEIFYSDYMDFRDNTDVYKFSMETVGTISLRRLATQDPGGGALVTDLQLLDSSGSVLVNISQSSEALNLDRFSLSAGDYYVRLHQFSGSGQYSLRIVSDYAGDTTATARDLFNITNSTRQMFDMVSNSDLPSYNDALDLYKFTLDQSSPLDLSLTVPGSFAPPTFDADLYLAQDNNFNGVIDSNEILSLSANSGNDALHFDSLAGGTYYIGVRQHGAYTSYQLDVDSDLDSPIGTAAPPYKDMSNAIPFGSLSGYATFSGGFGISKGDFSDFYKFTLTATGTVTIDLQNNGLLSHLSRSNFIAGISITKDLNSNFLNDSGEAVASSVTGKLTASLDAGTYYVWLNGDGQQSSYFGQISADYAGNSLATARPMAPVAGAAPVDQVFQDYIEQDFGSDNDIDDFYSFVLPANYTVKLNTTGTAGEDLSLALIKDVNNNNVVDDGDVLVVSDLSEQPTESITQALQAGKYFVRVHGLNGATNYGLRASFTAAATNDPDDTIAEVANRAANKLSLGQVVNSMLESTKDVDLYKFTATAGQRASFAVQPTGAALDTYLRIFTSAGTELAANDDGHAPGVAASKSSYLEYTFKTAGTYYVGVSLAPNKAYNAVTGSGDVAGGTTGTYRLSATNLGTQAAPTSVLRVNAGGNDYVTKSGLFYEADSGFLGGTKSNTAFAVAGTNDDPIYYSNRTGKSIQYSHSLANGTYTLTLEFAENTFTQAGQRKFDVFAQGKQVLNDFDIVAAAGSNQKLVSKSFTVNVVNGKIDLRFEGVQGQALISSISLVKKNA